MPYDTKTVLDPIIDQYLEKWRSLGRQFRTEEYVLRSLTRWLQEQKADDLTESLFENWCRTHESLSGIVRRNRQRIVRNFCLYRRRTDPTCFVPDSRRFPKPSVPVAPVILREEDIARLLKAAKEDSTAHLRSPLQSDVLRLAIVLLYTAGLRREELLRLTLGDADAQNGLLTIRTSKFHKSRTVPLSSDARREVRAYLKKRQALAIDPSSSAPLLGHTWKGPWKRYTGTGLRDGIMRLIRKAHVVDTDGRTPRIHDFRHSFAVQALLRWYRSGADVPSKLPKLALYMGHVSIVSTAYYLKWLPEIAEVASARFEAHSGHLITGGSSR